MHRSAIVFGLYLSFAIAIGAACSQPAPLETRDDDDSSSNGNNTSKGGSSNGGSISNNGGSISNNGGSISNNGGSVSSGGSLPSNGGSGGSAGKATGGAAGTMSGAGRAATGGSSGTGTTSGGSGGTTGGSAGTATTGGTGSGAAGSTSAVSCDTKFTIGSNGLVRAPMKGGACWHGYASAGVDTLKPDGGTASTTMPTSFAMCGEACMLQTAGSLSASDSAYAYLGFNVNEDGGSKKTITPTGTGLKVTFSKSGTFNVRVQISAGSAASTRWCADAAASPASIPYAMFNTECWEGGAGTAYAITSPIDQVQLSVPGKAAAATTFDVTLVSVEEY